MESILKVFKSKIWLVDFPNNNAPLNDYFKTYDVIERPIRVIENSSIPSFIFELWDNVFSKNDLETITKVASWLEKQGNNVDRSKKKMGTSMRAFGMQYAIGDLGW